MKYTSLAISDPAELIYGKSPKPIPTRHGLEIGGGLVYPELNFTLPDIEITKDAMPGIARTYKQIVSEAIVKSDDHYQAVIAAARAAIAILRETSESGCLQLSERETAWFDRMEDELDDMPDTEDAFIQEMMDEVELDKFTPADYGLPA